MAGIYDFVDTEPQDLEELQEIPHDNYFLGGD